MFAAVIPLRRTPRDKNFFIYEIAPHQAVQPGTAIIVELRKKKIYGVVYKIFKKSLISHPKKIYKILEKKFWLSQPQLDFLEWFAHYYFVSLPQALKTLWFEPKEIDKCVNFFCPPNKLNCAEKFNPHMLSDRLKNLKLKSLNLLHYSSREDCLKYYDQLISKLKCSIIFIVPEYQYIPEIANYLSSPTHQIISVKEGLPPYFFSSLIHYIQTVNRPLLVIGTKKILFLTTYNFPFIIIDQEESSSHKHYDQNPRYHVRTAALTLLKFFPKKIILFSSLSPSIDIFSRNINLLDIRHQANKNDLIKIVDLEEEKRKQNFSWFSDELIKSITTGRRHFLFFNRLGNYRFALCQDCSQLFSANVNKCTRCGSAKIKFRGKGVKTLETELTSLFPGKHILRIDREQKTAILKKELNLAQIIIGTEKIFRVVAPKPGDRLGILSVDHLLTYPHWQTHERVFQILSQIFSFGIKVILQTHAPHHWVIRAALTNNYMDFYKKEITIRNNFKYPPFGDYFLLKNRKKNKNAVCRDYKLLKNLDTSTIIDRLI